MYANFKFGSNGSVLNEIIKTTVLFDIDIIPANSTLLEDFAVPNAVTGSSVIVSTSTAFTTGSGIAFARVRTAGIVEVQFFNNTAGAINNGAKNYYVTVIR